MERLEFEMSKEANLLARELIGKTSTDPSVFAELRQFDQFVSYKHDNGNGATFEVIINPGNYTGGTFIMRKGQYYNKFTGNIPATVQAFVNSAMRLELSNLQFFISGLDAEAAANHIALWNNTIADKMTRSLREFDNATV